MPPDDESTNVKHVSSPEWRCHREHTRSQSAPHTDPDGGQDMGTQAAPRKRNTVDT